MTENELWAVPPMVWIGGIWAILHFSLQLDPTWLGWVAAAYLIASALVIAAAFLVGVAMFLGLLWRVFRLAAGMGRR